MTTPSFRRHGKIIKGDHAPHFDSKDEACGNNAQHEEKSSGTLRKFSKQNRSSTTVTTNGYLKARFADAIEYTGSPQGLRGLLLIWGLFGSMAGFWLVARFGPSMLASSDWFVTILGGTLFLPTLCAFGIYLILWTARLELFRPEDEPTIFDRRNRKVYRVFRETWPGWRGLFKRWPLRAAEYDWNLIDVEHQATLMTTGSTVTRYHALVFIVKKSATDPTVVDGFTIGHTLELGEQTVPALWEHIRRFMEEGGPHLPPGETLAPAQPPKGLWQSLAAVGPVGSSYKRWWKDNAGFMILIHVLFPVFVPFFLLWGLCNWLSYLTATRIDWSIEVKAAVGPSLD
ncbi:DUF6708 domain-containing protein [Pseudorhodoferax sp.]|uniref:DUF6708 domain-containing protein n=1 Tax=Pseudorhodoferax sp. TaxID=1993553 RepID=UPI0039E31A75